ncbi:efflux RND transporter periplasmic adaptor subunit [Thiomicrorhabdus sp. zzn3]|uniref:efflux RND transporter periplasmic adaptor subunit n=1 Tax=Thiomicrorhabdus sp. zzn3 TaxID=3039775 RepID=UPI002436EDE8|nr:efflux RND transporter periplasmic adaptor subunit [Thiomicrorhabdus sp. zzn3]MDG6777153.1 efflux RND transporter periplasmic adaptor subunit [Thiomicrorhabdus sp. zzn3]
MRRVWKAMVSVVSAGVVMSSVCSPVWASKVGADAESPDAALHDILPIRVTYIEAAPAQPWFLSGRVQRRYQIPLSFRVGGIVEQRFAEVGQSVAQGQVLARLELHDLALAVTRAEADRDAAQANALNAMRERERLQNLFAKKLVSEQDLQRAQTAEVSAKKSALSAESALQLAQRQLQYAQLQVPQDGVLTEVSAEPGQVITAGQPLMQLAAGDLEVQVGVPASRLHSLQQAVQAVGVDQPFVCEVSLRAYQPLNQESTLLYPAYFTLSNCSGVVPLGAVAEVRFSVTDGAVSSLQRVPLSAVWQDGKTAKIWQLVSQENGDSPVYQVRAQSVRVVRLDAHYAYIESALPLGEAVVAQGAHRLTEGQLVSALKAVDQVKAAKP